MYVYHDYTAVFISILVIDAKNREINYGPTKKECMRLVKDINDALVQLQSGKGMTVGSY